MKYYKGEGAGLSGMGGGLRLILSLYLCTTLLAFWLAALKYVARGLITPGSASRYYLGGEEALLAEEGAKSFGFLVDVTHPHLFMVPLVLLVLCHLMQLCSTDQRLKNLCYLASFLGMGVTFAIPWLVVFFPSLAPLSVLVPVGGGILLLSGTFLCIRPLVELWRRGPADGG